MKIQLPFYNLNDLPDEGGSIILAGPSFSGKTTMVLDILASKCHILNYAAAFSNTEKYNKTFSSHIHPNMVYYDLNKDTFEQVINFHKEAFEKDPTLRMAIVLDDVMGNQKFLSWPMIRELFFQSRHIGIFFLVSTQHLMLIEPAYRNSCRFIVFTKQPSSSTRKTYHTSLFGAFSSFKDFDNVYKYYTSEFRCLVLQCGNVSYEALKNLAYYKSNSFSQNSKRYSREFKIGSSSLWEHLDREANTGLALRSQISDSVFSTLY